MDLQLMASGLIFKERVEGQGRRGVDGQSRKVNNLSSCYSSIELQTNFST